MSEEVAATLAADVPQQTEQQPTGEDPPKADEKAEAAAPNEGKVPVKQKPQEEEKPQQSDPEEPEDDVPIVLVTGASGYLASHVVHQLLQDGRFRVRGTVRSFDKEDKVKHLREMAPEAKYPLRLIEADLLKPKTWIEAVRRCRFVIHVASPLMSPGKSKNPDVIIKPAEEGTTSVLKACVAAGTVKRVVVTSSTVAVSGLTGDPSKPADHVFTEADFSDPETGTPYERSKVIAEKAAWEFVKGLEADKQFELVTVCPGLLEGPLFAPAHKEGSVGFVSSILSGKMSRVPDIYFALADVRDTARAHIAALEKAEAAGNRYLSFTEVMPARDIQQILADEFKPQGYKVGVKKMPKAAMWAAKIVSSQAKVMYPMVGKRLDYSNEKMKGELGMELRPVKESLTDTGYSLIEMGIIPKKPGYLGHPSTRPPPEKPATEGAQTEEKPPSQGEQSASSEPAAAAAEKEPVKAEEPPSDQAKAEEPTKTEEQTKEEPPSEEPAKVEETPSEEPAKVEETPSEEPAKVEETPSEEPAKVEETPSEEPTKTEDTPSEEPAKVEPVKTESEEPVKEEEPASEPPKEDATEAPPTQEPETTEPEPKEEPSTEQTAQDEQPASESMPGEDPPTEPTNEEPPAPEPQAEEQQESESQDTPEAAKAQEETANDADTES